MQLSKVIAGGRARRVRVVRHIQLTGSQRRIGHDIAELAWSNHSVRPQPSSDATLTRARRTWRRMHWPQSEERAAGVADRWNLEPGDNTYETGSLFLCGIRGGCSVVWLPPDHVTTGAPMLPQL